MKSPGVILALFLFVFAPAHSWAKETTLANFLKEFDYATGAFGKWHLGYKDIYNPVNRGFDEYFGELLGHADFYKHTYFDGTHALRDGLEPVKMEGQYFTDLVNERERWASNQPFFHHKATLWEGGIRVPCLMSWPKVLPRGVKSAQAGITMDLAATFLKAAGGELPVEVPFDGVDLIPYLLGEKPAIDRSFYWRMDRTNRKARAIRHGKYKYLDDGGTMDLLFDLSADPGERLNLNYRHPEITSDLKARLKAWEEVMDASDYDMQVR